MDSFQGYFSLKSLLYEAILLPNNLNKVECEKIGLKSSARAPYILIFGVPGIGKTFLINCTSKQCGMKTIKFDRCNMENSLSFYDDELLSPSILLLDDLDTNMFHNEDINEQTETFLNEIDQRRANNLDTKQKILNKSIVICCSSMPHLLDTKILNRFDIKLFIDAPNYESRYKIINHRLKHTIQHNLSELDINNIAMKCVNYSSAAVINMFQDAATQAVSRCLMSGVDRMSDMRLNVSNFDEYFDNQNNAYELKDWNVYKAWNKKFNGSFEFEYESKLKRIIVDGYLRKMSNVNIDNTFINNISFLYLDDEFMMDIYSTILLKAQTLFCKHNEI